MSAQTPPSFPAAVPMSAKEVSEKLKPLVAVITPGQQSWLTHQEMPSASFGAGMLLQANSHGYLFVTAHHVIRRHLMAERKEHVSSPGCNGVRDVGRSRCDRSAQKPRSRAVVGAESPESFVRQPIAKSTDGADGDRCS